MMQPRMKRMQWAASFVAAATVHIVLGVMLAVSLRPNPDELAAVPERRPGPPEEGPSVPAESPPAIDREEVQKKIETSLDLFANRDEGELASRGEKAAEWLESRSEPESIDEIGAVVRDACDAPPRAYAPADPPPSGDFDYDTMLPFAVRQTEEDDGSIRVTYTWVDAQGRAMEVAMPETASDPALTAALKMAQRSPMMRQLFQTSVLPVLETQLRRNR